MDVPWRRRGALNGIDERLSVDMINAAKEQGAVRLSLAFAAFPEIFDAAGDRRYVLLSLSQVAPLLVVLLSLEFMPRRRRLTG